MYTRDEVIYLTELAWCVGLFEGEGCIHGWKDQPKRSRVKIEMTDKDVMDRFFNFIKLGNLTGPYHSPCRDDHITPIYHWSCSKRKDVIKALSLFWTIGLGERRQAQADEAMERYEAID